MEAGQIIKLPNFKLLKVQIGVTQFTRYEARPCDAFLPHFAQFFQANNFKFLATGSHAKCVGNGRRCTVHAAA
jgi:hypothetical protein